MTGSLNGASVRALSILDFPTLPAIADKVRQIAPLEHLPVQQWAWAEDDAHVGFYACTRASRVLLKRRPELRQVNRRVYRIWLYRVLDALCFELVSTRFDLRGELDLVLRGLKTQPTPEGCMLHHQVAMALSYPDADARKWIDDLVLELSKMRFREASDAAGPAALPAARSA